MIKVDAIAYIKKAQKICDKYEVLEDNCKICPLGNFACGLPKEPDRAKEVVELVEKFDFSDAPSQTTCAKCGKDLPLKPKPKYCPNCGAKL